MLFVSTEKAVPNAIAWTPGRYVELSMTTPPFAALAIICPPFRTGVKVIFEVVAYV